MTKHPPQGLHSVIDPGKHTADRVFVHLILSEKIAIASGTYISYAYSGLPVRANKRYRTDIGADAISTLYFETGDLSELYSRHAYRKLTLVPMVIVHSLWEKVKVN